jgi:hypothetical protein
MRHGFQDVDDRGKPGKPGHDEREARAVGTNAKNCGQSLGEFWTQFDIADEI